MMRFGVALLFAFGIAFGVASADPASNQLITGNALQAGITAGTFIANGSCPSGNQVVTYAQLTTCIRNTGGCTSSPTNSLPKWADALACRVLFTTPSPVNDPWFTLGANTCCWTGSSSTPTFVADATAPGSPGNAQSLTSGTIVEGVSPSSILSGSPLVFRLLVNNPTASHGNADCAGDVLDPTFIASSTTIQVVGPGNVITGSVSDSTAGWHTLTLSTTASAGTGAYTLVVVQRRGSGSYSAPRYTTPPRGPPGDPPPDSICNESSGTFTVTGFSTGASIGNS